MGLNEDEKRGFLMARNLAALLLEDMAEDFETAAAQKEKEKRPIWKPGAQAEASMFRAKATLLRGQAKNIREELDPSRVKKNCR